MSRYPNLNIDPDFSEIKTEDDEIKSLKYKTEKHDFYNSLLQSLKVDNEHHKKNYKSLKIKKVILFITEISLGSDSAITASTMSLINPSIGIVLTSSTALLTSFAILITNEYLSKLKFVVLNKEIRLLLLLCYIGRH